VTSRLDNARALLRRSPLVDGHNDLAWALREAGSQDLAGTNLAGPVGFTHTDLPRLAEGGVGAQFWSVYVPVSLAGEAAVAVTLEQIDFVHRMAGRYPDRLELALSAADVERIFAAGRVASLIGAEGGHSIGCSLGALRALYRLGVRYLTLTHSANVPWADSATDEPAAAGLTAFGREVVAEMQRLGMLVDLSHTAPPTMRDAFDAAVAPVIYSHSSARALCDHPRNVPDEMLARLPGNNGVCMVTFVPAFVSQQCREWHLGLDAEMKRRGLDPWDQASGAGGVRTPQPRAAGHAGPGRRPYRACARGGGGGSRRCRRGLRRHRGPPGRPGRCVVLPGARRGTAGAGLERAGLHAAGRRQHPAGDAGDGIRLPRDLRPPWPVAGADRGHRRPAGGRDGRPAARQLKGVCGRSSCSPSR
jgi:membrane dipeptidase